MARTIVNNYLNVGVRLGGIQKAMPVLRSGSRQTRPFNMQKWQFFEVFCIGGFEKVTETPPKQ
jgi:phage terminase large subunit-like protein